MRVLYFQHFHLYPYILLASSAPCIALGMIRSIIHKPHYIFLKTTIIPTYHGISIAILRYTVVQLPSFVYITSSFSYLLCMIIEPQTAGFCPLYLFCRMTRQIFAHPATLAEAYSFACYISFSSDCTQSVFISCYTQNVFPYSKEKIPKSRNERK